MIAILIFGNHATQLENLSCYIKPKNYKHKDIKALSGDIMAKITLYQYEGCPFCAKVRAKLEELNLEYEKVNVSTDGEDETRVMIREKSNVSTVPVIDIDGEFTGDSGPIIQKLESMG